MLRGRLFARSHEQRRRDASNAPFRAACSLFVLFSHLAAAETPSTSPYGVGDRLGALNNLRADTVLQAASLVKVGKVYSLAIETQPTKEQSVRQYRAIVQPVSIPSSNKLTGHEDTVIASLSLGTSIDGLGHVGRDGTHYNGVRSEDVYNLSGAKIFSIDTLPPIVTRGILLDIARYRGTTVMPAGEAINQADIEGAAKKQRITIQRGDVVLLHSGWLQSSGHLPSTSGHPGLGKDGARYLAKLGVVAVGGDTPGEVHPAETKGEYGPVHQILLVDHGVYLFESVRTQELASDQAYEFLFVAAAPRLSGTVQSPVHPVAIR